MNKTKAFGILGLITAALVLGLSLLTNANAAVGPGGVSNQPVPALTAPRSVTFSGVQRVVTDAGSTLAPSLTAYGVLDLQYLVVGADGVNTFTLKLQHSNDGSNWVDGATIASNIVPTVNTTDMTRTHNYAAFTRVFIDVTNSVPITLTINAIAR